MPELYEHFNPMPFEAARWKQSWLKIYELPDTQLQAGIERSPFSPRLVRQTGSGGKTPIRRQQRRASFLNLIARIVLTNVKACLHTGHRKSGFWIGRGRWARQVLCLPGPAMAKINSNREGKEEQ